MFTWQFETRPTIYDVISDCWLRPPMVQMQQLLLPSSVSPATVVGGEHQPVPHQSVVTAAALQALPVLGQSVEAGVRLAPSRAHPATGAMTTTNGSLDQHHRQSAASPTATVGGRQQQSGDHSRLSCITAPSLPYCVIPVVDVGPNTVVGLAGHHVLQQQHQQLHQSQFQYSQPIMSPASSL